MQSTLLCSLFFFFLVRHHSIRCCFFVFIHFVYIQGLCHSINHYLSFSSAFYQWINLYLIFYIFTQSTSGLQMLKHFGLCSICVSRSIQFNVENLYLFFFVHSFAVLPIGAQRCFSETKTGVRFNSASISADSAPAWLGDNGFGSSHAIG